MGKTKTWKQARKFQIIVIFGLPRLVYIYTQTKYYYFWLLHQVRSTKINSVYIAPLIKWLTLYGVGFGLLANIFFNQRHFSGANIIIWAMMNSFTLLLFCQLWNLKSISFQNYHNHQSTNKCQIYHVTLNRYSKTLNAIDKFEQSDSPPQQQILIRRATHPNTLVCGTDWVFMLTERLYVCVSIDEAAEGLPKI